MAKVEDVSFSEMSRFNRIARKHAEVIWETGHGPSWTLELINEKLDSLKRGRRGSLIEAFPWKWMQHL